MNSSNKYNINSVVHKVACSVHYSSAIHKAAGLTVPGRSMILTGTFPMEQKSVHWLSMGAGRNGLWGAFQPAVFWEWPVTKEPAAL